jgi:uncharacterized membrane protein
MPDLLHNLARLDRTKVFLVALVVALVAVFLPGIVGGLILLAIVVLMAALLRRTWPIASPGARILRVVILGVLAGIALFKIF